MVAVTIPPADPDAPAARIHPGAVAALVVFALGMAGSAMFIGHPAPHGDWTYDEVAHRHSWWSMHFYGGLGTALLYVGFGPLVVLLCRARSATWAAAGAVLSAAGGVLFGIGVAMEGAAFSYATDPAGLPAAEGAVLMAYLNDSPGRYLGAINAGQILIGLGWLALLTALWRSRTTPRWVAPAIGLGLVISSAIPFTTGGTVIEILLVRVPSVFVAVLAARSSRFPASTAIPWETIRRPVT